MANNASTLCTAFQGPYRIASGGLREVAAIAKTAHDRRGLLPLLFFDDTTSEHIEVDLRGSQADVAHRFEQDDPVFHAPIIPASPPAAAAARGVGRPKLGVVAREVTLLPRHWEWLARQSGGASVALRKLIDEAKRSHELRDRTRAAQESAYRFMSVMAGDEPGFEEATRALFASDQEKFEREVERWPNDIRDHASVLANRAFGAARYGTV